MGMGDVEVGGPKADGGRVGKIVRQRLGGEGGRGWRVWAWGGDEIWEREGEEIKDWLMGWREGNRVAVDSFGPLDRLRPAAARDFLSSFHFQNIFVFCPLDCNGGDVHVTVLPLNEPRIFHLPLGSPPPLSSARD